VFKVALMTTMMGLTIAAGASAQTAAAAGSNGVLEWQIRTLDLHRDSKMSTWTAVSVRVEIKNVGMTPVAIAIMNPAPTVRMDGGLSFDRRQYPPSGVAWCNTTTVQGCDNQSREFTRVRPGQTVTASMTVYAERDSRDVTAPAWGEFVGELYVKDLDNGQSMRESIGLSDVKVTNNLR